MKYKLFIFLSGSSLLIVLCFISIEFFYRGEDLHRSKDVWPPTKKKSQYENKANSKRETISYEADADSLIQKSIPKKIDVSKSSSNITVNPQASGLPVVETLRSTGIGEAGDLAVPYGAAIPAAFLDEGAPGESESEREALKTIKEEFFKSVQKSTKDGMSSSQAWEEARQKSDAMYRSLFGDEPSTEASLEAAGEAAEEMEANKVPSRSSSVGTGVRK
jgi:hypothetical protein